MLAELQGLANAVSQLKIKEEPERGPTSGRTRARNSERRGGRQSAPPSMSANRLATPEWASPPSPSFTPDSPPATSSLAEYLRVAAIDCRQDHRPLSLMLVELGSMDRLLTILGAGIRELRQRLHGLCREVDHPAAVCVPRGETGFAIILPDCERRTALQLGDRLIRICPPRCGCRSRAATPSPWGSAWASPR